MMKNPPIFSVRNFRRLSGTFICAVKACISIIQRADLLQLPAHFPVGVYRCSTAGDYRFIRGVDMSTIMRYACCAAYPADTHYMRLHMDRIMAHSNRVTACLALHQADIPAEVVAFCLR
jgi:sialic acid synthase SpsE